MNKKVRYAIVGTVAAAAVAAALGHAMVPPSALAPAPVDQAAASATTPPETTYAADKTTEVLIDAPAVDSDQIVKVIKHGDHWHVFTKDGREIITYTDPSRATSSSQLTNTAKVVGGDSLRAMAGNGVVRILKHGDHYHVYTADGHEYITYDDPSGMYPGVPVGTYTGSHGSIAVGSGSGHTWQGGYSDGGGSTPTPAPAPSPTPGGGSQPVHPGSSEGGSGAGKQQLKFVQVVSLDELRSKPIVKILKHDDHYHAYTADGTEFICREDPSGAFPGIKVGTYVGKHGDGGKHDGTQGGTTGGKHGGEHGGATPEKPSDPVTPIEQDENDPKRVVSIEHHEDHWHIHHADGSETVTHQDPSGLYPGIKITEYDPNQGHHFEPLKPGETFTYEEITGRLMVPLEDITYGNVIHTIGYDKEEGGFVIPHHSHYHHVSIETIIQLCRYGDESFHGHDPREVVATLKYLVEHPEARPKGKDGWGSASDIVGGKGEEHHEHGGSEDDAPAEKKVTRIVHDGSVWIVYYDDGSFDTLTRNPKDRYPGVSIEEAQAHSGNEGMSDDQIIEKYSALYGMTRDEFEDILLDLPYAPLKSTVFNDDGTVMINGTTYDFKNHFAGESKEEEGKQGSDEADESHEEGEAESGEDQDDRSDEADDSGSDSAAEEELTDSKAAAGEESEESAHTEVPPAEPQPETSAAPAPATAEA